MIPNCGSSAGMLVAKKTEGKEKKNFFFFNLFCKDLKAMEEILRKTSASFVTLATILLQIASFINEGTGLLTY